MPTIQWTTTTSPCPHAHKSHPQCHVWTTKPSPWAHPFNSISDPRLAWPPPCMTGWDRAPTPCMRSDTTNQVNTSSAEKHEIRNALMTNWLEEQVCKPSLLLAQEPQTDQHISGSTFFASQIFLLLGRLWRERISRSDAELAVPLIYIWALSVLYCPLLLIDGLNNSLQIQHQLRTSYQLLSSLKPICGRSTRSAIQCLKSSHIDALLITVVVKKFYQRKMLIPWTDKSNTHDLSMSLRIWIVHYDYPSVWGWYTVQNLVTVPNSLWNEV